MRIACLVPFCPRTRSKPLRDGHDEWICADHWRLTSRRTRLNLFRARRKRREEVEHWIWQRLKKQAIEAGMGIG